MRFKRNVAAWAAVAGVVSLIAVATATVSARVDGRHSPPDAAGSDSLTSTAIAPGGRASVADGEGPEENRRVPAARLIERLPGQRQHAPETEIDVVAPSARGTDLLAYPDRAGDGALCIALLGSFATATCDTVAWGSDEIFVEGGLSPDEPESALMWGVSPAESHSLRVTRGEEVQSFRLFAGGKRFGGSRFFLVPFNLYRGEAILEALDADGNVLSSRTAGRGPVESTAAPTD